MSEQSRQAQAAPSAPASQPVIVSGEGIEKTYNLGGVQVEALRGVSLTVGEGEFVSIVGPSGSGKSTLLNILGLIESPSRGRLFFDGEEASGLPEARRSSIRLRSIGFVFQAFNLLPGLSAEENVAMPMRFAGVGRAERKSRSRELLASLGLSHRLKHKPLQLSGGERQRVAIARALANRPRLILADEPTGNLDSATGEEILSLLLDLNRRGLTIVMVTHNTEMARLSHRTLRLRDGLLEA